MPAHAQRNPQAVVEIGCKQDGPKRRRPLRRANFVADSPPGSGAGAAFVERFTW